MDVDATGAQYRLIKPVGSDNFSLSIYDGVTDCHLLINCIDRHEMKILVRDYLDFTEVK